MKLIGLISPNSSEETLVDVYKIFPKDIRIEARNLHVAKYTDDEFHRAEMTFQGLVRDLVKQPLDFLMVTGELFLSYKGPGSDREILDLVKQITPTPASTVLTAVTRGCRALGLKRVVMASPFPEDQDERLVKFLAHDGIDVVAFRGLGLPQRRSDLATGAGNRLRIVDGVVARTSRGRRRLHAVQQVAHGFRHRAHRERQRQTGGDQYSGVDLGGAARDGHARADYWLRPAVAAWVII